MPGDFLDTSALAKHYHAELGSAEVDRLWSDPSRSLFVSRLSVLEMLSVLAGKVRAGVVGVADVEALRRRFAADVSIARRLVVARVATHHYQEAESLLRRHAMAHRLRTLDALQLAIAVDLHRRKLIGRIVAADRDLLRVAGIEGLEVLDPERA